MCQQNWLLKIQTFEKYEISQLAGSLSILFHGPPSLPEEILLHQMSSICRLCNKIAFYATYHLWKGKGAAWNENRKKKDRDVASPICKKSHFWFWPQNGQKLQTISLKCFWCWNFILCIQIGDLMDVVLKKNLSETPTQSVCVPTSKNFKLLKIFWKIRHNIQKII